MDLVHVDKFNRKTRIVDFDFDFSVGQNNTFEISVPLSDYFLGYVGALYVENSSSRARMKSVHLDDVFYIDDADMPYNEYGGVVTGIEVQTEFNQVLITGITWRALLDYSVCFPLTGQTVPTVAKASQQEQVNEIMSKYFTTYPDVFTPTDGTTGSSSAVTLSRWMSVSDALKKTERGQYLNVIDTVHDMTADGWNTARFTVYPVATSINDDVVYTSLMYDGGEDVVITTRNRVSFNCVVIALGSGEYPNRDIVYMWKDVNFGMIKTATAIEDTPLMNKATSAYVYDYNTATHEELLEGAETLLYEIWGHRSVELPNMSLSSAYCIGQRVSVYLGLEGYDVKTVTGRILRRANMVVDEQIVFDDKDELWQDEEILWTTGDLITT